MKTEKEKMLAGLSYNAVDPELVSERASAKKLLQTINVTEYLTGRNVSLLLKNLLPNASTDVYVEPPFHCDYGYNIKCGKRVYFNVNCVLLDSMPINIGSHVMFGPGVHIYTATHPIDSKERRKTEFAKPVTIGDDCWIGGSVIILPGVTIGRGSVIGAGSVVTKDVPEFSLFAGNPAKFIRHLL